MKRHALTWMVLALGGLGAASCGNTVLPRFSQEVLSQKAIEVSPRTVVLETSQAEWASYFEPGRSCHVVSVVAGVSTAIAVQATMAAGACAGTMAVTGPGVTVCLVPAAPGALSALVGAVATLGVYMACEGEDGVTETKVEPLPPTPWKKDCGDDSMNNLKNNLNFSCRPYDRRNVSSFDCYDLRQCIETAGRCFFGITHDFFMCKQLEDFGLQSLRDGVYETFSACLARYKDLKCTQPEKPLLGGLPTCAACFNSVGTPRQCGMDPCAPSKDCGPCPVGYTCAEGLGMCTPADSSTTCENLCQSFKQQVALCQPYVLYPQASGLPLSCECSANDTCTGDSTCEVNVNTGLPQCVRTSDAPVTCICVASKGSFHCHQDGDAQKPLCAENCCAGNAGGTRDGNSPLNTCLTYVGSDGRTYLADGVDCLADCGGVLRDGTLCSLTSK